jgi:hypothetical protein
MPKKLESKRSSSPVQPASRAVRERAFDEVLALIDAAKRRAYQAVNTELVALYWRVGEYISKKIARAEWGDGVVEQLAAAIARQHPGMRGFTRPNLFRMRQFYETYAGDPKVSPLVRLLPWTLHLGAAGEGPAPGQAARALRAARARRPVSSVGTRRRRKA